MKSLLDHSPLPIEWFLPAILVIALLTYLTYRINQIRRKHISTKKLDVKTVIQLLLARKNKRANWENFQKCEGLFEDQNSVDESYGGGVSGSW